MTGKSKSPTILLVDDDPAILKTLGERLRSADYRVIFARDGDEAVKKALALVPQLVILDINLPKRLGFSVARMLRLDTRTQEIPILMLSARSAQADFRLGEKTGADAYLTKPYDPKELLHTIAQLLSDGSRRAWGPRPSAL
jgi:DNA-binding response OmpR family regulator